MAMSPNSMPSATIVWAICGRMPEMMHSAPISRAATTVLRMCWATWVSTAGTPVMSMIAYGGAGVDQGLQQLLHDHLGAGRVQRADQRHRHDAVPELDHRRGQLEQLLGLVGDHLLAGLRVGLEREQAEVVDEPRELREVAVRREVAPALEDVQHRLLEREHADRGLGGGEPLPGPAAGQVREQRRATGPSCRRGPGGCRRRWRRSSRRASRRRRAAARRGSSGRPGERLAAATHPSVMAARSCSSTAQPYCLWTRRSRGPSLVAQGALDPGLSLILPRLTRGGGRAVTGLARFALAGEVSYGRSMPSRTAHPCSAAPLASARCSPSRSEAGR